PAVLGHHRHGQEPRPQSYRGRCRLRRLASRSVVARGSSRLGGPIMIVGYARVSTNDQDLSSQLEALKAAGAEKVWREKVSGAKTDRPELAKLMRSLNHGDVLLVTRLDRLARSTRDLLNVLDTVTKAGAAFKSLADAWADTTTPHGRLMLPCWAAWP